MPEDNNRKGDFDEGDGSSQIDIRRRPFIGSAVASSALLAGIPAPSQEDDAEVLTISNDQLTVFVKNRAGVGTFTMKTADGRDLLYGDGVPGTSYLTVRVDGTNYVTADADLVDAPRMDQHVSRAPTVSGNGSALETEWRLPEDLVVTQTITLKGEAAEFEITIDNTGQQDRSIDVRYLFDYQVDQQDGAPIFVNGEVLRSETRYESPGFRTWQTYDRLPEPELKGKATIGTQPDVVDFVEWEDAVVNPYEYDHASEPEQDPGNEFYTPDEDSSPASDSVGLLYWERETAGQGDRVEAVTYYGTGEPVQTELSQLVSSLDQFRDAVDELLTTSIESQARTHAELYKESGESYRENLVNYYGYKAGIVAADAIDTNLREELDRGTDSLDVENEAEDLYRFFNEMFASVDRDADLETIENTFAEHLWGTAPDQEYVFEIGGDDTFDDVRSGFQETFRQTRNDTLEQLRTENVSSELMTSFIDHINSKIDTIRSRQTETKEYNERIVSDIKAGNRIKAHQRQIESAGVVLAGALLMPADDIGTGGVSTVGISAGLLSLGVVWTGLQAFQVLSASTSIWTSSNAWIIRNVNQWLMWTSVYTSERIRLAQEASSAAMEAELEEYVKENYGVDIEIITGVPDLLISGLEILLKGVAEEGLERIRSALAEIEIADLSINNIDSGDVVYEGYSKIARGSGTVTVRNMSSSPVTPHIVRNLTEITSYSLGGELSLSFPVSAHVFFPPPDDLPEIEIDESETIEFDYYFPIDLIPGIYEFNVGVKADRYSRQVATKDEQFFDTSIIGELPDIAADVLDQASILEDEVRSFTRTIGDEISRTLFNLNYPGSDLDLHLYDEEDNHVGVNYTTGELENEIPEATWSGPDGGVGSQEGVIMTDSNGTYTGEVVAVETDRRGTDYSVTSIETPELPATVQVSPSRTSIEVERGKSRQVTITIEELGGFEGLDDVSLSADRFTREDGEGAVDPSRITFSDDGVAVNPGNVTSVEVTFDIPDDVAVGTYTGSITVSTPAGSEEVHIQLDVSEADEEWHTLRIAKDDTEEGLAVFAVQVDGELEPGDEFDGTHEGDSALDWVGPNRGDDDLRFSGEITRFLFKGKGNVYFDGDQVDPANVGSEGSEDGGGGTPDNTLRVAKEDTDEGLAVFAVWVDGELEPGDEFDGILEANSALDWVGPNRGEDELRFSGEITRFLSKGKGNIYLNGEQLRPDELNSN